MAQFYFDTDDGALLVVDDEGFDCTDVQAARDMLLNALPDMARQGLKAGDRHTFSARMRDESGAIVYSASLTLEEEWSVQAPAS
ncbi:MAG: hypothetical protein EOO77_30030 [Oxalobacteraceae bacterium]|nr:MAG: hypothetical protein EOO77_30030 [Oxalobacteraceae bacterium]